MRNKLGPGTTLSYCMNVHPIGSPDDLIHHLGTHPLRIAERLGLDEPLAVGLFLPKRRKENSPAGLLGRLLAAFALEDRTVRRVRRCLEENHLYAPTSNAFPFRGFHEQVVKHRVYEPDWGDDSPGSRVGQTLEAAHLLDAGGFEGSRSISTLPIGWSDGEKSDRALCRAAAETLKATAYELEQLAELGDPFTLDLEPEPGCVLDTCDDVIAFFDEHLPGEIHRRHIGVCHDVCHAAVMFEDQREVLRRYADAGIRVNKVQISSALAVDVRTIGVEAAIEQLRRFAEPRYLHQTGFMTGEQFELIEDLPEAIERLAQGASPDRLRVHFHVPVYLDRIGQLGTTNNQIAEAVAAAREYHDTKHFEVETYAWGVLPDELKRETLAEGIADELRWVLGTCGVEA